MRPLITSLLLVSSIALAQAPAAKKQAVDAELKKKETSIAPDKSLAGDITRKKKQQEDAPTLQYDAFRLDVELQVASKRREQITDLSKIIDLSTDKKEKPGLLFRLGELYWEESKFYFFEANRKDDEKIKAMNAKDEAGIARAESEKAELMAKSKEFADLAVEKYYLIVQEYKTYERTDEVLYFLGLNLMDSSDDKNQKKALASYKRLIEKYQKSKYLPDAYLAVAEYYFNGSKGKRESLEKALENYKNASKFPENKVYGYALYKQGWCHFNMADYENAMNQFKTVVLYAKLQGDEEVEGKGKSRKQGLVKEARGDYVRAYSRGGGTPTEAKDRFNKLADKADDLRLMMKQLANLYYEDGKDREAAVTFDMLIKERPTAPDAPGFQGKIVDCVMRAGNKRQTVTQVRRLVKIMDDVLKGNPSMNDKDKKALDEARELSERTISNLAVNWHNEAKKTRDEETFGFANEVYADYLTLFPESPKAYDLRFFWAELLNDNLSKYQRAAEEYTRVTQTDIDRVEKKVDGNPGKPGKWMNNASYNSILAWDSLLKEMATADAGKTPSGGGDPSKKAAIPPVKQSLLDACERYLKYVEKGEKKVEIAYKAAKIYYDYNYLDEAVSRFADIALKYPDYKFENGDRAGEIAANLVLDSYNILQDWGKVNEWAKKFYAEEKLATGKFREDLAKLIEQSSFKLINQLEAKNEYGKAADAYMTFVQDWPKSDLADKALYNASIDYFNAKMLDRAIEVRKQLIQRYPKSQYVPKTLFALAEGYEAVADFDDAADHYERYASNYEKSRGPAKRPAAKSKGAPAPSAEQVWEEQKAQDALYNAGVFRDGLGQYKQALKNREKFLELWPKSKDAEAVTKSIIDLHEKMGLWTKAQKLYEEYEKDQIKDPSKLLWAEGRIASIYEEKLKNPNGARKIFVRILDYYEKLNKKQKEALDIQALDGVARASFVMNEDDFKRYSAIKLKWTTLQNIGELKGSIKTKAKGLEDIQKAYTKTVQFKSADPAICALARIGLAYDQFAEALSNPPVPKGIPEELLFEVKNQFEQEALPIRSKASEAFAATVQKSQELDVFNPCSSKALEMLRTKYKSDQFPKMGEETFELKPEDGAKMTSIGQGLLTTIQPIPVISPERAAELKSNTSGVGKNVVDSRPRGEDPDTLPPPKSDPKPEAKTEKPKATATTKPAATPAKPSKNDDEPEDTL
ncbi:MAG: tetratricopeptide repeat protein [Myxococcales bacterium]|nr:tetratricopeptide repeat protein [Myxococcales bacterium]MDP3502335.1 tetratricopeptide repeat protein [Myxococcales bacterium]